MCAYLCASVRSALLFQGGAIILPRIFPTLPDIARCEVGLVARRCEVGLVARRCVGWESGWSLTWWATTSEGLPDNSQLSSTTLS